MFTFLRVIDRISTWTGKLISYIMLPVMAVVCYEVLMRYVFHRPTVWASESMIYGCAILYCLGAAWTMVKDRHVRIDMLYERFSVRTRAVMDTITGLFFFLYLGMMLWIGSRYAWESLQIRETSGTPWDPPIYPIKIIFVIGVALLLLQGFAFFVRNIYTAVTGKQP